jgi:sugar phosphate isomerase/epimerase
MKGIFILFMLVLSEGNLPAQDQTKPAKLGIVSYTFRNGFAINFEATLDTIQSLGINNIEFSNLFTHSPEYIRASLDRRRMFCTSYGVSADDLRNKTMEVGNTARILGAGYVRLGWLPLERPLTAEDVEKLALEFNRIGKLLKTEFGLDFVYHNHGYEFHKWKVGTLFDLLVQKTDPAFVNFELDILWAHIADGDPAGLLLKYPARFRLMHVKDLKKGTKHDLTGQTDINNDVTLGTGEINIPEILNAAAKSKIQYYYIEDESTRVMEQVPQSIVYLRGKLK